MANTFTYIEKKLFTPGPLGCSKPVKEAMLFDLGSRDTQFINVIKEIRQSLLEITGASPDEYTAILLQGSGTYSVEAALQMCVPRPGGRLLIVSNGAYGKRMKTICDTAEIPADLLDFPEDGAFDVKKVEKFIYESQHVYSAVSAVHLETSSGVINPATELGKVLMQLKKRPLFILDGMSSIGGVSFTLDNPASPDVLVTSANKCLQSVPGCAIIIARRAVFEQCKGNCRSLSLDLCSQLDGLDTCGQFRFTPPTHCLLALHRALGELKSEGGVSARVKRYRENCQTLQHGMEQLGFQKLVKLPEHESHIITSYLCPKHPNFAFDTFYSHLSNKGQVIYPGKVTNADSFRIGNIGDLHPKDLQHLASCIKAVLTDMGVPLPVRY
ncbi:2-aminoethylphosphonate--pyruvate transaminase-like [Schistocerca serialis cubense]|uniref:2-aminoethylphosphonate--pyruvate transaminase-like n=1 Tax=Schistocerca serialis cubense TaxID=2023355 RepID=UPI00214E8C91|nr:2-aminoethylphosphonate--pyruvate transaminase-like [Schistocerca serialis cubense]